MRFILVVIVLLLPFWGESQQENFLKNGDFERFVSGEPVGWTTNNIPKTLSVVSASSKSQAGKNSLKCEVKEFFGTPFAGTARQTEIPVVGGELRLSGFYLLKSVGNDVGFISVDVKTAAGSTVAVCEHFLREARSDYAPFSYSAQLPPEAERIDLLLTLMPPKVGSSLHVGSSVMFDDVKIEVVGGEQKQL